MVNWFEGPWKVIPEKKLEDHPRVIRGEIMVHPSGSVIVACPACGSMQFAQGTVEGDAQCPTLRTPIVCGSGYCTRCGEKTEAGFVSTCFTIIKGKAVKVSRYPSRPKARDLPPYRGLRPPQKIE